MAHRKKNTATPPKPVAPKAPTPPSKVLREPKCEILDGGVRLSELLKCVPENVPTTDVIVYIDDYSSEIRLEWAVEVENEKYDEQYIEYLEKMKKYEEQRGVFVEKMKVWQESESVRKSALNKRINELELELAKLRAAG